MTAPDPALAKALDDLTTQVNRENILAAHKVFRDSAHELDVYLLQLMQSTQMGLCGGDPVSREAVGDGSFGGKIRELLDVHRAHQQELVVAAEHLHQIARTYGYTEDDIEQSLHAPRSGG